MNISGWGNYPSVEASTVQPDSLSEILRVLESSASAESWIARGLGRSYGDSALAANVIDTKNLDCFIDFDATTGILDCSAGVSLESILRVFAPRGWFLPVTPGTKFVTVGGAISSDVHGKNHHRDGGFSDYVVSMNVATPGAGVLNCTHETNGDLFRATAGGMGLTGVILNARIQLIRIQSTSINEVTLKANNLEEALELFQSNIASRYSVAWIDCLASGKSLGRSILSLGEHAQDGRFESAQGLKLSIPFNLPDVVLNKYSIKAFNTLHYHSAMRSGSTRTRQYDSYFYPLDSIANWNRMYGRNGFVQYQFVLPIASGLNGLKTILERIVRSGHGSFLAVLKLLGKENDNYLSFPAKGYTLALDFKVKPEIFKLLDELDAMVLDYGGKVYLAKDARLSVDTFRRCYPNWERVVEVRQKYGADKVFNSIQSDRLGFRL